MTFEFEYASAEAIQAIDFDHPFMILPNGNLAGAAPHVYAPEVYLDDGPDEFAYEMGPWTPLSGFTGQHGYNGPVMHASEYVGEGIASELRRLSEDEAQTFVLCVVNVLPEDGEENDPEPAGWTILQLTT